MNNPIFLIVAIIYLLYAFIKEKTHKKPPEGTYFDYDAYWKDIENGMDAMEKIKKRKNGGYLTTKPKK